MTTTTTTTGQLFRNLYSSEASYSATVRLAGLLEVQLRTVSATDVVYRELLGRELARLHDMIEELAEDSAHCREQILAAVPDVDRYEAWAEAHAAAQARAEAARLDRRSSRRS